MKHMFLVGRSNPKSSFQMKVPQYAGTAQYWKPLSELPWLEEGNGHDVAQTIFCCLASEEEADS